MANRKRKTTAQKQRAKARQQRAAIATAPPPAGGPAGGPAAAPAKRPPQRRPAARSRRSSRWMSWTAVGGVVAVVAVMIVFFVTRNQSSSSRKGSEAAIAKATSVQASTLEQIGVPSDVAPPPRLPAGTPPVQTDGKPTVLYVGAEYCPYCAAERWPMVVALSRFGTFAKLSTTSSAGNDVFPNTPTFSFYGSSYTSSYLAFSSAETESNNPSVGGGYTHLQDLTAQQRQLFSTYNTKQYVGSDGGIPFVMVGNLYAWAGASYDPGLLKGLSFDQIANQLGNPNSKVAQGIDGSANQITAMICELTGNQPAKVCSASYIQQEQAKLKGQ